MGAQVAGEIRRRTRARQRCAFLHADKEPLVSSSGHQLARSTMSVKMKPDFLIQKRVALDNQYASAAAYARERRLIGLNTGWFESKTKGDPSAEKRMGTVIKEEMDCA